MSDNSGAHWSDHSQPRDPISSRTSGAPGSNTNPSAVPERSQPQPQPQQTLFPYAGMSGSTRVQGTPLPDALPLNAASIFGSITQSAPSTSTLPPIHQTQLANGPAEPRSRSFPEANNSGYVVLPPPPAPNNSGPAHPLNQPPEITRWIIAGFELTNDELSPNMSDPPRLIHEKWLWRELERLERQYYEVWGRSLEAEIAAKMNSIRIDLIRNPDYAIVQQKLRNHTARLGWSRDESQNMRTEAKSRMIGDSKWFPNDAWFGEKPDRIMSKRSRGYSGEY